MGLELHPKSKILVINELKHREMRKIKWFSYVNDFLVLTSIFLGLTVNHLYLVILVFCLSQMFILYQYKSYLIASSKALVNSQIQALRLKKLLNSYCGDGGDDA